MTVLVFVKSNKKVNQILGMFALVVVGMTATGMAVKAVTKTVEEIMTELSYNESWLNSEEYLVTAETISRIFPETEIENVTKCLNKEVKVEKNGEEVEQGKIETGMNVSVKNPTKADAEGDYKYTVSVWGDTNGDSKSNQVDLTTIIRNVVDEEKWKLEGAKYISADVTVDDKIEENDVKTEVEYIVYGNIEIPAFEQVKDPTITVVSDNYDEDLNCYMGTTEIKIEEQEEAARKTEYKIETIDGIEVPYTVLEQNEEGKNEKIIEIENDGIYKISAYTTGKLGNRSNIPNIIVNKGLTVSQFAYTVEYYYDGELGETVGPKYANYGEEIKDYESKEKTGFELDRTENVPLTIGKKAEQNVMKIYYRSTTDDLIIHHYEDKDGALEKVAADEIINIEFGEDFEVTSLINKANKIKIGDNYLDNTNREYLNTDKYNFNRVETDFTVDGDKVTGTAVRGMKSINFYYGVNTFRVTAEIIEGEGNVTGTPKDVRYGDTVDKAEIKITPSTGWKVTEIKKYVGEETTGAESG